MDNYSDDDLKNIDDMEDSHNESENDETHKKVNKPKKIVSSKQSEASRRNALKAVEARKKKNELKKQQTEKLETFENNDLSALEELLNPKKEKNSEVRSIENTPKYDENLMRLIENHFNTLRNELTELKQNNSKTNDRIEKMYMAKKLKQKNKIPAPPIIVKQADDDFYKTIGMKILAKK